MYNIVYLYFIAKDSKAIIAEKMSHTLWGHKSSNSAYVNINQAMKKLITQNKTTLQTKNT